MKLILRAAAAGWICWCCACSKTPSASESAASASASAPPAPAAPVACVAPSATSAPRAASEAGQWSGSYEARLYRIEMSKKEGAVREWGEDKGDLHTGKGSLTVDIAEGGSASGAAKGPLGELQLTGELDGPNLRLQLSPADPQQTPAFTGVLLAKRDGSGFTGRLQVSSGDSLIVREAPVSLRKKGP
jgi:hypothetical protein